MCDICVLYLLKKRYFYRNKKYQYVDDPDASTSEDEASFPVCFPAVFLKTCLLPISTVCTISSLYNEVSLTLSNLVHFKGFLKILGLEPEGKTSCHSDLLSQLHA